jgi:PhnB protein
MTIKSLNPYINFNGNAAQAIKLYERVLGARVQDLKRFAQIPGGANMPEDVQQRVVHCELAIDEAVLMVSDAMPDNPVKFEGNVQVVLHFTDVADLHKKFDALALGGQVTFPVHDAFFGGAKFGMLSDEFGVRWMFICQNV